MASAHSNLEENNDDLCSFKLRKRRATFGTKGHFHERFPKTRRDKPRSAVPYLPSVDLYHGGELYVWCTDPPEGG